jgi:hypothetical protein
MIESSVTITTQVELTPEQVAEGFWNLGSEQQATFFFHLGKISGGMLGMQAIYMREACEQHESIGALMAFQNMAAHAFKFGLLNERLDQWSMPPVSSLLRKLA